MFQIKVGEKIETHFIFSNFFPPNTVLFMGECGKIL